MRWSCSTCCLLCVVCCTCCLLCVVCCALVCGLGQLIVGCDPTLFDNCCSLTPSVFSGLSAVVRLICSFGCCGLGQLMNFLFCSASWCLCLRFFITLLPVTFLHSSLLPVTFLHGLVFLLFRLLLCLPSRSFLSCLVFFCVFLHVPSFLVAASCDFPALVAASCDFPVLVAASLVFFCAVSCCSCLVFFCIFLFVPSFLVESVVVECVFLSAPLGAKQ